MLLATLWAMLTQKPPPPLLQRLCLSCSSVNRINHNHLSAFYWCWILVTILGNPEATLDYACASVGLELARLSKCFPDGLALLLHKEKNHPYGSSLVKIVCRPYGVFFASERRRCTTHHLYFPFLIQSIHSLFSSFTDSSILLPLLIGRVIPAGLPFAIPL